MKEIATIGAAIAAIWLGLRMGTSFTIAVRKKLGV